MRIKTPAHISALEGPSPNVLISVTPGLDYHGECRAAAGFCRDFFDFVPLEGGEVRIAIGEISADAGGAGILLSGLQAALRNRSLQQRAGLLEIVQGVNQSLCDISPNSIYVSLLYAQINAPRRQLRYISAGHEPVLLFRKSANRPLRLENTGTVLGLTPRAQFREKTVPLDPGDILVAFTDGVTNVSGPNGQEFREEGLIQVVGDFPNAGARELASRIMEASEEFCGHGSHADDRTVLAVRMLDIAARLTTEQEAAQMALAAA